MSNEKECLPIVYADDTQIDYDVIDRIFAQYEAQLVDVTARYNPVSLKAARRAVIIAARTPSTSVLMPVIRQAVADNEITIDTIADFVYIYSYTPEYIVEILEPEEEQEEVTEEVQQLLEDLENYKKSKDSGGSGFQMPSFGGGMCGAEQLTQARDKIQDLTGAIQHAKDLVKPDPKFSPKPPAQIQAMIDQIKQKVESLGKQQLQQVTRMMQSAGGSGIEQATEGLLKRLGRNSVFLRPEQIDAIKNNLDRVGSQSAAQFKDPEQKDNLKLQQFRMCQIADSLGSYLTRPVEAAKQYDQQQQDRIGESKLESQEKQGLAKTQGVDVPPYARRKAAQARAEQAKAKPDSGPANTPSVSRWSGATAEENQWVAAFKAKAAQRQNPSDGNIKVVGGALQNILNPNKAERRYANSIVGAKDQVLIMARRVAKALGRPLQITSAYRCPPYNRRVGGARRSNHMQGIALDILWPGGGQEPFIAACSRVGFTGMSSYSSFLHVDIGRKRTWGGGRRNKYVQRHLRGYYLKQ